MKPQTLEELHAAWETRKLLKCVLPPGLHRVTRAERDETLWWDLDQSPVLPDPQDAARQARAQASEGEE